MSATAEWRGHSGLDPNIDRVTVELPGEVFQFALPLVNMETRMAVSLGPVKTLTKGWPSITRRQARRGWRRIAFGRSET